jgi:hypothetical protein
VVDDAGENGRPHPFGRAGKAAPADDVVTPYYYTWLPQIRDEAEVTKNIVDGP